MTKCRRCRTLLDNKNLTYCNTCKTDKCHSCKNLRLRGSNYCLFHFVRNLANSHGIRKEHTTELVSKLYLQGFKCYYTGILLLPSVNASLDHIIPKTKNGTNDLVNLVWVDFSVNRMKSNMDLEDFISRYSDVIEEYKLLSSFETEELQQEKLNYVLRTNIYL